MAEMNTTTQIDDITLLDEVIEHLQAQQAQAPACDAGWYQNAIGAVQRALFIAQFEKGMADEEVDLEPAL